MIGRAPRPHRSPSRLVLLGDPVTHSLSPRFQNAALDAAGFAVRYEAVHTSAAAFADTFAALHAERAAGNVTVPHKERAFTLVQQHTDLAARTGAVNTFWVDADGVLVGHNTDVAGVDATLARLLPGSRMMALQQRPVAVLGAGGSAAAVLVSLAERGAANIRVWSRTVSRVDTLAARVAVSVERCASAHAAVADAVLVINATPVGMRDDALPVDVDALAPDAAVFDLVYREGETAWVRAARARGLTAQDGLEMLVEQGAAAFGCWFDVVPSRTAMWRALGVRT